MKLVGGGTVRVIVRAGDRGGGGGGTFKPAAAVPRGAAETPALFVKPEPGGAKLTTAALPVARVRTKGKLSCGKSSPVISQVQRPAASPRSMVPRVGIKLSVKYPP